MRAATVVKVNEDGAAVNLHRENTKKRQNKNMRTSVRIRVIITRILRKIRALGLKRNTNKKNNQRNNTNKE